MRRTTIRSFLDKNTVVYLDEANYKEQVEELAKKITATGVVSDIKTMIETNAYTTNMNQSELLNDGVDWLRQRFGDVGTEMFISLIIREKFDYTRWRRQFFGDKTVSEINEEAADYSRNHPFKPQKPQVPIQREG